jgi:hypothetical protein
MDIKEEWLISASNGSILSLAEQAGLLVLEEAHDPQLVRERLRRSVYTG